MLSAIHFRGIEPYNKGMKRRKPNSRCTFAEEWTGSGIGKANCEKENKEELYMKKWIALLLALTMLIGLTACSKPAEQTTEDSQTETSTETETDTTTDTETETAPEEEGLSGKLVFWTQRNETETQGQVFQEYADDFMALHEGVEIEIQFCGRDIDKTLKAALDGGEVIDIYDYPLAYGAELADKTLDLTEYLKKSYSSTDGKTLEEVISPALLATAKAQTQTQDQQLAVGYSPYLLSFMYNADIFEQAGVTAAPTTWEELDAVCAAIKEQGIAPITFDDAYSYWLAGMYLSREKGEDFIAELIADTTGEMWRDEAVVKMAKAFEDFANKGYFHENVGGNKWPAGQIDLGTGKAAMYYNATWLPNEIRDTTGPDFNWGAFTYPDTNPDAGTSSVDSEAGGSSMLGVSKSCANPELAMEFIAFMYTPENDQKMVEMTASIPSGSTTPWPDELVNVQPVFNSVTSILKVAGGIDANADIKALLSENVIQLCAGKITADQFVENMVAATKQ